MDGQRIVLREAVGKYLSLPGRPAVIVRHCFLAVLVKGHDMERIDVTEVTPVSPYVDRRHVDEQCWLQICEWARTVLQLREGSMRVQRQWEVGER